MQGNARRIFYAIVLIISLFLVFFVGREFNAADGTRNFIITNNGLSHFRKWLDVSGWSRLVYQIDYTKYNELYKDPAELAAAKKNVETIILKNIDKRISSLWVSDYKAYIQTMDNENYVVVEIGGIANLDEAKKIIGRTVELEFRLPNKEAASPSAVAQRRSLAQNLYNSIKSQPNLLSDLAGNRSSEDIYYNKFTAVTLAELPTIYQKNPKLLETTPNTLSPLLEGTYLEYADTNTQEDQTMQWFSFFRVLNKQEIDNPIISATHLIQSAVQFGKTHQQNFAPTNRWIDAGSYSYNANTRTVSFNNGEVFTGQIAYDVRVAVVSKANVIGKSPAEVEAETARVNALAANLATSFSSTSTLPDGVQEVYNSWIDEGQLKGIVPTFDPSKKIMSAEWLDGTYIVFVRGSKQANEQLFSFTDVSNVSTNEWPTFKASLEKTIRYTLEDVFVQDKETWIAAVDPTSKKILDGAYFQMASVSSSQVGQPVVLIQLNDEGKAIFCNITANNIGSQMAIFVGWQLVTAPTIQDKICAGTAQIDGQFDTNGAKELAASLNDGTLPAPLLIRQEEKIDASLGANAFTGALVAWWFGILLVVTMIRYMYGWRKTLVTLGVLVYFIIVLAAMMKLIDYALSLSAIAAVILSIGMAVDANILIFERVREELLAGKKMTTAIDIAYDRSRAPIRDGNFSTGLIALVLFTLWVNIFKWFGSMMLVNMVMILALNVPVTRELLHIVFHKKDVYLKEWNKYLQFK